MTSALVKGTVAVSARPPPTAPSMTAMPRVKKNPEPRPLAEGYVQGVLEKLRRFAAQSHARRTAALAQGDIVALCKSLATAWERELAEHDGRPPYTWTDSELLCRCALTGYDLGDAIGAMQDFCRAIHPRGGELILERRGDTAVLLMNALRDYRSPAGYLIDIFGLMSYQQMLGWLIGEPLRLKTLFLAHASLEDAAPFNQSFNVPVVIRQPVSGFEFDAAQLARLVVRRPAELKAFLEHYPFQSLTPENFSGASFEQRVRTYLNDVILYQQKQPAIAHAAAALGLSEATLRRRLGAEGTSFQEIRDGCLREAAQHYLRNTGRSIEDIATALGFSDSSAFRRAFQRWTNIAPSQLRRSG